MTGLASRRSILGGLTALPLVSGGVVLTGTAAMASPALVRLVERYEAVDQAINGENDRLEAVGWNNRSDTHARLCGIAGQFRRRIACHPVATMSDVLLKARAYAITLDPADDWACLHENFTSRGGHGYIGYIDDIAEALVLDLIRLNGFPTAVA